MNRIIVILLLSLPVGATGTEWQADPEDKQQLAVQKTIESFLQKRPELSDYFQQAWGYAVFPRIVKFGAMFGGAYGKGLVIENDALVGRCSQSLVSLGAQLGAQSYKQLILFRNEAVMEAFKNKRVELKGRASIVVIKAGAAVDPAYLPDVAIFSLTEGGLMFEAAVAGVKYGYKPIKEKSTR